MDLYGYVPSLRPPFDKIRQDISTAEQASHRRLEDALQEKLKDEELLRSSDSATVGNALRKIAKAERQQLRSEIRAITDPLVANILKIINLSDQDLIDPNKRAAQIAIFNPQTNR